jgi:H+-transporting ATPase
MALTTDHVKPSVTPSVWRVGDLTLAGIFMGIAELMLCVTVLLVGKHRMGLGIDALRTLAFVVIVFGNQATTYMNRARQHLWSSAPSRWLVLSSVVDLTIASTLANRGWAMAPLPLVLIGATLAAAVIFALVTDFVKIPVYQYLGIADASSRGVRRNAD